MDGEAADRERRFCLRSFRAHRRRFLIYRSLLSIPSDEFSLMKRLQRLVKAVHVMPCNTDQSTTGWKRDYTRMYDLRYEIGFWDLGMKAIDSLFLHTFGNLVHPLQEVS